MKLYFIISQTLSKPQMTLFLHKPTGRASLERKACQGRSRTLYSDNQQVNFDHTL